MLEASSVLHMVCAWLWSGHLTVCVGDGLQRSEKIGKKSQVMPFRVIISITNIIVTSSSGDSSMKGTATSVERFVHDCRASCPCDQEKFQKLLSYRQESPSQWWLEVERKFSIYIVCTGQHWCSMQNKCPVSLSCSLSLFLSICLRSDMVVTVNLNRV